MKQLILLCLTALFITGSVNATEYELGTLQDAGKRSVTDINVADVSNNEALDALEAALKTEWQITRNWGGCSRTCGTGTQTRELYCPPGFDCGPKPATSRNCNTHACSWSVSSYGSCNKSCDGGTQWRTVTCPYSGACNTTKPATSRSCNTHSCTTYKWYAIKNGDCDKTTSSGPSTSASHTPGRSCSASNLGNIGNYGADQCGSTSGQPHWEPKRSICLDTSKPYVWYPKGQQCSHSGVKLVTAYSICSASDEGSRGKLNRTTGGTCGGNQNYIQGASCQKL